MIQVINATTSEESRRLQEFRETWEKTGTCDTTFLGIGKIKYYTVSGLYPDGETVTERFETLTGAKQYAKMIRNDAKNIMIHSVYGH